MSVAIVAGGSRGLGLLIAEQSLVLTRDTGRPVRRAPPPLAELRSAR